MVANREDSVDTSREEAGSGSVASRAEPVRCCMGSRVDMRDWFVGRWMDLLLEPCFQQQRLDAKMLVGTEDDA